MRKIQKMNDMNVNVNAKKSKLNALVSVEDAYMILRAKPGRDSQNVFFEAVHSLVISVARQYVAGIHERAVELDDLINVGSLAAFVAAENFDGRGDFAGYAKSCIRFAILSYLGDNNGLIHLPEKQSLLQSKMRKEIGKLTQELDRTPTLDEVAETLKMDADEVEHLYGLSFPIADIDGGFDDSDDDNCRSLYGCDDSLRESLFGHRDVRPYLDTLSERRRQIVCWYQGIDTEELNFTEIGRRLGISHEAVRQQYNKAIEQLRQAMEADGWNLCA